MHGDGEINWGTPKRIQQQKSKDDPRWHSNKPKVCFVTKGEHVYDQVEVEFLFNIPFKKQWRCKCGKKGKYELVEKFAKFTQKSF